jgi:flagellar motor switch protein FliG
MSQLSPSLRKAAVLISALDDAAADALLQQMGPDQAAKVRRALMELGEVPAGEQQRVLTEFLSRQGAPALALAAPADELVLENEPANELSAAVVESDGNVPSGVKKAEPPLDFLRHVPPAALAAVLRREQPQTVAVVIAQLEPEQAAAVLQELPSGLATESLERMAWIEEPPAEVWHDLASELRQQLAPHWKAATAEATSLAHLSAVLGAMQSGQRQRVVLQLAERNTALLGRLGLSPTAGADVGEANRVVALRYRLESRAPSSPALQSSVHHSADSDSSWLTFDDLALLDDAALRLVLSAANPQLTLLALTGADSRMLARILRQLPAREAAVLRQRLEHPGPVRLRDIERAQRALAATASRLAHEGTISLPPSVRFAAAV